MIHEKLADIQKTLKAPKSQLNKFGGYKYRSCEDILEAVKPLLGDTILTISDELVLIGERYYIKATAMMQDCLDNTNITVSAYAREEETKKGMDASQITGSASSYARKYALNGLLLIDDTKDADATNTHREETKPVTPDPTPPPAPKPQEAPKQDAGTVSEAQRKRLFAISNKSDKSKSDITGWLKDHGMMSSKELKQTKYDELVKWIETPKNLPTPPLPDLPNDTMVKCPNDDGAEQALGYCRTVCERRDGCPSMEVAK